MQFSYSEITEKFLRIEEENQLLFFQIDGYYPWQMARIDIFLHILDSHLPVENKRSNSTSIFRKGKIISRRFLNSLLYNPFFDFKRSDILIFESGRKYKTTDEFYKDIYTHYLAEQLNQNGQTYTIYETYFNEKELLFKSQNVKHLDFVFLLVGFIKRVFPYRKKYKESTLQKIQEYEKQLNSEFHISVSLSKLFNKSIKKFNIEKKIYSFIFKIKKAKEIFIINSSDKAGLIAAAKENSIIVNELQHGLNSDQDVILNYPFTADESLAYFPNKFYIWNNINLHFSKLPLKEENIIGFTNKHLVEMRSFFSHIKKKSNCILIISQPYNNIDIQNFVLNNINKIDNLEVVYKIHPADNKESLNNFINKIGDCKKITFIDNEVSIYQLMMEATFVIGIYSSALFEAVFFNCKVFLIQSTGVEMSYPLIVKGAKLINIETDLNKLIKSNSI